MELNLFVAGILLIKYALKWIYEAPQTMANFFQKDSTSNTCLGRDFSRSV